MIWLSVKITLLYFEWNFFNKMALASSSTKPLTYARYLINFLKLLIWFEIVIPSFILNLNTWIFKGKSILFYFCPNMFFISSQISTYDSSKSIWWCLESKRERSLIALALPSLLLQSNKLLSFQGGFSLAYYSLVSFRF